MNEVDKAYFAELKKSLSFKLRETHSLVTEDISEWRSKEILIFQEDLLNKVNGRISEKWFYTHIKADHKSLPRIDILDLLSCYLGHDSWAAFKNEHRIVENTSKKEGANSNKYYYIIGIISLFAIATIIYSISGNNIVYKDYQFCFVDQYSGLAITEQPLSVVLLHNEQSPGIIRVDEQGCIRSKSKKDQLKFIIRSPYYSLDTITRNFNNNKLSEVIEVKPNDYALIIHLFSNGKVEEWNDRKEDLNDMFHDNARIYQNYTHSNSAISIYNKEEFINKLTLPTGTLKNLEIQDMVYEEDKIMVLRFKKGNNEK